MTSYDLSPILKYFEVLFHELMRHAYVTRLCKFVCAMHLNRHTESRDTNGGSVNLKKTRVALFHAVNHPCKCKNGSLLRSAIDRLAGYMMFVAIPTKRIVQPALPKEGRVSVARHQRCDIFSSLRKKHATIRKSSQIFYNHGHIVYIIFKHYRIQKK